MHIVIRTNIGDETQLALTVDAISKQSYEHWALDIISSVQPPDMLEDQNYLAWHVVAHETDFSDLVTQVVNARELDWVVELPSGAQPTPCYLNRIREKILSTTNSVAIFVDDCIESGDGTPPFVRYKPGVNPAALISSDLTGPLCIERKAWLSIGGTPNGISFPWFQQMLNLSELYGWPALHHIPGCLMTLPPPPPSPMAHIYAKTITEHFQNMNKEVSIRTVAEDCWIIELPIPTPPPTISLVVISKGNEKLITECIHSIQKTTSYENLEIIISTPEKFRYKHQNNNHTTATNIRTITATNNSWENLFGTAIAQCTTEYVVAIDDEIRIIQENWLHELLRPALQDDIVACVPRQAQAGSALIENIGNTLGLNGIASSPYRGTKKITDRGYLNLIQAPRDLSTLSPGCFLIKKSAYLKIKKSNSEKPIDTLFFTSLGLKLKQHCGRIVYQPTANVAIQRSFENHLPKTPYELAKTVIKKTISENKFKNEWWPTYAIDIFWNTNLSLNDNDVKLETEFHPEWWKNKTNLPRILARHVPNGQGFFRVTSPIDALKKAGLAQGCTWAQDSIRDFSQSELLRIDADTLIVQNYVADQRIMALDTYINTPGRPFIIFTLDDLITDLSKSNPMITTIPPNIRARLNYALARCDRLVVSTDFLAENYRDLISDIKVIPNYLEQEIWLPLTSHMDRDTKPRIGWAGGISHHDDLMLLKPIIEATRDEAIWVFMGMCPNEIRYLIHEYHPKVKFHDYPKYLASLDLDIAVAPLADTLFNRGKSNLRLLEYGALNIPVVCTDIDPYRNSPACQVGNNVEEWVNALRDRIYDPEERKREGTKMRRWVCENYLIENNLDKWLYAHTCK